MLIHTHTLTHTHTDTHTRARQVHTLRLSPFPYLIIHIRFDDGIMRGVVILFCVCVCVSSWTAGNAVTDNLN